MFQPKINAPGNNRRATVAVLVSVSITVLFGIVAITLDGGLLQDNKRSVQNAADGAALAACNVLFKNFTKLTLSNLDPGGAAKAAALKNASDNGFPDGTVSKVEVMIPPTSGPFKGNLGCAEVFITYQQPRYFSTVWGATSMPVQARAVARGFWGGTGNGVIVLDPAKKSALDSSGNGSVAITGGAAMMVNSNHGEAARATGGGSLTAKSFNITGGYTGPLNGEIKTGTPPIPDPLAYLPAPAMPANGTISSKNAGGKGGGKTYYLTPGRHSNLPNFGNGDTVILQQGGIYYIDGGGLTSTNGASIIMDSATSGGVLIYNAPTGTQSSQGINISGGTVNLSPLTSGIYAGIVFWQERTSPVQMSIQGQGGFTIKGTFYAANALLSVSGQGNNTIGSQYISRTLNLSGGGNTVIDYTDDGTARKREVRLVE